MPDYSQARPFGGPGGADALQNFFSRFMPQAPKASQPQAFPMARINNGFDALPPQPLPWELQAQQDTFLSKFLPKRFPAAQEPTAPAPMDIRSAAQKSGEGYYGGSPETNSNLKPMGNAPSGDPISSFLAELYRRGMIGGAS